MSAGLSRIATTASSGSWNIRRKGGEHPSRSGGVWRPSPLFVRWFTGYSMRLLRRRFHAVRLSRSGGYPEEHSAPVVLYGNHPSWWDPLVALLLRARFFSDRALFAPIDEGMLGRYGILSRLGFFGVEQGSLGGARRFLQQAEAILQMPDSLLALTPQGRFVDARARPVGFQPGIGHLARRAPQAVFLPVAMELTFWNQPSPEILLRFGAAIRSGGLQGGAKERVQRLENALTDAQDELAMEVRRRDAREFECLLSGRRRGAPMHEAWRWIGAKLRGASYTPGHGEP